MADSCNGSKNIDLLDLLYKVNNFFTTADINSFSYSSPKYIFDIVKWNNNLLCDDVIIYNQKLHYYKQTKYCNQINFIAELKNKAIILNEAKQSNNNLIDNVRIAQHVLKYWLCSLQAVDDQFKTDYFPIKDNIQANEGHEIENNIKKRMLIKENGAIAKRNKSASTMWQLLGMEKILLTGHDFVFRFKKCDKILRNTIEFVHNNIIMLLYNSDLAENAQMKFCKYLSLNIRNACSIKKPIKLDEKTYYFYDLIEYNKNSTKYVKLFDDKFTMYENCTKYNNNDSNSSTYMFNVLHNQHYKKLNVWKYFKSEINTSYVQLAEHYTSKFYQDYHNVICNRYYDIYNNKIIEKYSKIYASELLVNIDIEYIDLLLLGFNIQLFILPVIDYSSALLALLKLYTLPQAISVNKSELLFTELKQTLDHFINTQKYIKEYPLMYSNIIEKEYSSKLFVSRDCYYDYILRQIFEYNDMQHLCLSILHTTDRIIITKKHDACFYSEVYKPNMQTNCIFYELEFIIFCYRKQLRDTFNHITTENMLTVTKNSKRLSNASRLDKSDIINSDVIQNLLAKYTIFPYCFYSSDSSYSIVFEFFSTLKSGNYFENMSEFENNTGIECNDAESILFYINNQTKDVQNQFNYIKSYTFCLPIVQSDRNNKKLISMDKLIVWTPVEEFMLWNIVLSMLKLNYTNQQFESIDEIFFRCNLSNVLMLNSMNWHYNQHDYLLSFINVIKKLNWKLIAYNFHFSIGTLSNYKSSNQLFTKFLSLYVEYKLNLKTLYKNKKFSAIPQNIYMTEPKKCISNNFHEAFQFYDEADDKVYQVSLIGIQHMNLKKSIGIKTYNQYNNSYSNCKITTNLFGDALVEAINNSSVNLQLYDIAYLSTYIKIKHSLLKNNSNSVFYILDYFIVAVEGTNEEISYSLLIEECKKYIYSHICLSINNFAKKNASISQLSVNTYYNNVLMLTHIANLIKSPIAISLKNYTSSLASQYKISTNESIVKSIDYIIFPTHFSHLDHEFFENRILSNIYYDAINKPLYELFISKCPNFNVHNSIVPTDSSCKIFSEVMLKLACMHRISDINIEAIYKNSFKREMTLAASLIRNILKNKPLYKKLYNGKFDIHPYHIDSNYARYLLLNSRN